MTINITSELLKTQSRLLDEMADLIPSRQLGVVYVEVTLSQMWMIERMNRDPRDLVLEVLLVASADDLLGDIRTWTRFANSV